jgi:hypothetical protein
MKNGGRLFHQKVVCGACYSSRQDSVVPVGTTYYSSTRYVGFTPLQGRTGLRVFPRLYAATISSVRMQHNIFPYCCVQSVSIVCHPIKKEEHLCRRQKRTVCDVKLVTYKIRRMTVSFSVPAAGRRMID